MHAKLALLLLVSSWTIAAMPESSAQEHVGDDEAFDAATLSAPFSTVLVREKDVFAVSDKGLFRASLDEKQWKRLPIGVRIPPGGLFGQAPKNTEHLFYYSHGRNHVDPQFDQGLYHSTDAGQTWCLISNDYDFQKVYMHEDGSLYAIIERTFEEPDRTWIRWSILRAPTLALPLKWQDITGDIGVGVELYDILEDPDHPELVRLRGNTIRSYILHAADKNYQWQMTFESPFGDRQESDDAFLAPKGFANKILYLHRATLANYFDHPFDNRTEIHAWTLQSDSTEFTFARNGPKAIPVSIGFLKDDLKVRFVDARDTLDCWAVYLVTPAGDRIDGVPRGLESVWRDEKKRAEYRAREPILSVDVSRDKPYLRTIDLDKLADLSQPGRYRLRLVYHSGWLAENDEWSGSFSSEVLTIDIR